MMKRLSISTMLLAALFTSTVQASGHDSQRDEQAISVLKAMSTHLASLESFTVTGLALEDERLEAGLMASYPTEIKLTVKRPGSLHLKQFDGEFTRDLYIYEGSLTLYDSEKGYYATTSVPAGLDAGMEYALETTGNRCAADGPGLQGRFHAPGGYHRPGALPHRQEPRGRRRLPPAGHTRRGRGCAVVGAGRRPSAAAQNDDHREMESGIAAF